MDISITVIFCVCTVTDSPPRKKLMASKFARRFIGILGRESHILWNFAPTEAQKWINWPERKPRTGM